MTFGTRFSYTCSSCGYKFEMTQREPTLFMAEHHILDTNHKNGILKKTELDNDWNNIVIYVKNTVYHDPKNRFLFLKGAQK